ncbi:Aste57867_15982 [Aphanomyces stellatus]|uniref:Aste57867_15982 protein n=1 Tax=Aphanomyces stellatus TaxID=120398 RepID=A0A485L696_9STRA|nr:hypothetical protein As57867_015926 [Aphanomyces stellatus]VFT92767.1 Aste57867_15982 [Aphanomyces stellatus]
MTTASMVELFKALHASDPLESVITETENGDELALSKFDLEFVLALAELLMAVHSPLIYNSDAALMVATGSTVDIIASHRESRSLAANSISTVLLSSRVGAEI